MSALFWLAYILTVAEFIASPVNVLRRNPGHMVRYAAWGVSRRIAVAIAVLELVGVAAVIAGLWLPIARRAGGIELALVSAYLTAVCLRARYSVAFSAGLALFGVLALVVAAH